VFNREVIAEIDTLRQNVRVGSVPTDNRHLNEVRTLLENSAHVRREVAGECLIEDLRTFEHTRYLSHTKAHINSQNDRMIISLFSSRYYPSLSLDCLEYRCIDGDNAVAAAYPSKAVAVAIQNRSAGFGDRVVVALFPENHIDATQHSDDLIFYFVDKFVERHRRITSVLLRKIVSDQSFCLIRNLCDREVELASATWVRLHEYHHHTGPMPIPEYLMFKRPKPLAGLEELRVDILAMLCCLQREGIPSPLAEMTFEFILSERLLRYSIEGIPEPNYDAVASQFLFNFLREHGGIELKGKLIRILPELPNVLRALLDCIRGLETLVKEIGPPQVQQELLKLIRTYTSFDEATRRYRHIEYFKEVKDKLGL